MTAAASKKKASKQISKADKYKSKYGMEHLSEIPAEVPKGKILVHNHIIPAATIGLRGFRIWLSKPHKRYKKCDCGWHPELGTHYRVKAIDVRQKKLDREALLWKEQHPDTWDALAAALPAANKCNLAALCKHIYLLQETVDHIAMQTVGGVAHDEYTEVYFDLDDLIAAELEAAIVKCTTQLIARIEEYAAK